MLTITALAFASALFASPVERIVLRDGTQIDVSGDVRVENGRRAVFRSPNGVLYSLPVEEIDVVKTEGRAASLARPAVTEAEPVPDDKRIRVTPAERERLLSRLKESRGVASTPRELVSPSEPSPAERKAAESEEWEWRRKARQHDEDVRFAREELEVLIARERQIQDHILALLGLGYRADQFSREVLHLERTRNAIPRARLELERAERRKTEFLDEARRRNILPGWLR